MHAEIHSIIETSYREGKAEGRAEGMSKILLRILERRFGSFRLDLRDRVSSASLDQLRQWVDGVLDSRSPEEALGLPNSH